MRLSVIVPVYNGEERLERCLDSLERQTLEELEVLVVNDGSVDGTQEIINQYVRRDRRFRCIAKPANEGLGPARNTGLKRAAGAWVGFVDGDDWVDGEMFEALHGRAIERAAEIVICDTEVITGEGRRVENMRRRWEQDGLFMTSPAVWNKIYRKNLFLDHGILFPASFGEDLATVPRLMMIADRVEFVPKPLYKYDRTNSESMTATFEDNPQLVIEYLPVLAGLIEFFREHPKADRHLDSFKEGLLHQANAGCFLLRRYPHLLGGYIVSIERLLEAEFPGILTAESFPWPRPVAGSGHPQSD